MLLESRQAFLDTPLFAVASFLFSEFCLQRSFFFMTPPRAPGLQIGVGLFLHGQPAVPPLPDVGRALGPLSIDQGRVTLSWGALP